MPTKATAAVGAIYQEQQVLAAAQKLAAIQRELTDRFIERGDLVTALCLAALSRKHVAVIGDAGEAKTAVTEAFARRLSGRYFYTLLGRQSKSDQVLGTYDPAKLMQGRFARRLDGRMADVEFAAIDEFGKCNAATLNDLLGVLNERRVEQDGVLVAAPLEMAVGMSNEELKLEDEAAIGDSLRALWDRFSVRVVVRTLSDAGHEQFLTDALARRGQRAHGQDVSGAAGTTLALNELHVLQQAALQVTIPDNVVQAWLRIRANLRTTLKYVPSTRATEWALDIIAAHALLSGRTVASEADLVALRYVLWDKVEQQAQVEQIVMREATPNTRQVLDLHDQAREIVDNALAAFKDTRQDDQTKMGAFIKSLREIDGITKRVEEAAQKARDAGEPMADVEHAWRDLQAQRQNLVRKSREVLPEMGLA